MGTSGHRGHGLHGIGSRHGAARSHGSAGRHIRRAGSGTHPLTALRAIGRRWLSSGLGLLLAGAILQTPVRALHAQVPVRPDTIRRTDTIRVPIPAHADSLLLDTLAKKDSLHPIDTLRADTIKAPIAHAEMPAELGIGRRLY